MSSKPKYQDGIHYANRYGLSLATKNHLSKPATQIRVSTATNSYSNYMFTNKVQQNIKKQGEIYSTGQDNPTSAKDKNFMRDSTVKEERNTSNKQTPQQLYPSPWNALDAGNIKVADLALNKFKPSAETTKPNYGRQSSTTKPQVKAYQHSVTQKEVQVTSQNKTQSKEQQELQRSQNHLNSEFNRLQQEKLKFKDQISSLQKRKSQLSQQIAVSLRQKQSLEVEISQLKDEAAKIKTINSQTKGRIGFNLVGNRSSQNTQSLKSQLQSLKNELKRKDAEIQILQRQKNVLGNSREFKSNQRQLEDSRKLRQSCAELEQKLRQSDRKIVDLHDQIARSEKTIKQLISDKDKLQKQYKILTLEIYDLKKKSTDLLKTEENSWEKRYEKLSKEFEKLKKETQELKANKTIFTTYNQYHQLSNQKQKQLREANFQKKRLTDQNNNLKKQLEEKKYVQSYKKEKEYQRSSTTQQPQQLNKQIAALAAENEKLKSENANLLQQQKTNSPSKNRISQYTDKIRNLELELQNEQKNLKNNEGQIAKLRTQLQQRRKQIQKLKELLKFKQDSLDRLENDKSQLNFQITQLNAKIKERQKIDLANKQLNTLKLQYQNQKAKLSNKNNTLQGQNSSLRSQIAKLKDDISRLNTEKITLSPVKARNSQLLQQNESLKSKIKEQTYKYQRKQQEIKTLKAQHQRYNAQRARQLQSLKTQVVEKQSIIRRKEEQSSKSTKAILEKDRQLQNSLIQIQNRDHKIAILQSLKQSEKNYQASEVKLKEEISNLMKENSSLKLNAKSKEQQLRRMVEETHKLRQESDKQIKSLNLQLLGKQNIIKDLKNNNSKTLVITDSFKEKAQKLEQQKKNLQNQKNQTLRELKRMASNLQSTKSIDKEIISLQNELKNRDTTIENLKQQVQRNQFLPKTRQSQIIGNPNERKYQSLQQQNKKLQKKLQQKELYLKQLQNQNRTLHNNYSQLTRDGIALQNQKDELQSELDELHEKYEVLFSQNKQNNRKMKQNSSQEQKGNVKYLELKEEYAALQRSRQQLQTRFDQLEAKYNNLLKDDKSKIVNPYNVRDSQEITKIKTEKTTLERKVSDLTQDIATQKQSHKQSQAKLAKVSDQLNQLKTKLASIERNLRQKSDESQLKNKEINLLKEKNTTISSELSQVKTKLLENEKKNLPNSQNIKELQAKERQINKLRQELAKVSNELSRLKTDYSQLEKKHSQITNQNNKKQQLVPSLLDSADCNHLFHGDVLRDNYDYKVFLRDCIQRHQKIKILDTRLIYRYDPINKQNIHKYIDEKPQIVVVIQLENGYFLAGYAEGMFKPKSPSDKQGLIMSLTRSKCYYLAQRNKRSIAYDDFFVIFGNSEIRIKSQQKKIFSNFGVSNSYYRHNGDGVDTLMGGLKTEREKPIVGYQFFQLILKE